MITNHDIAAAKIDEALHLIASGGAPNRSDLEAALKAARTAINHGRYLTAAELAARWRCSAGGLVKRLRIAGIGPAHIRPSSADRGMVLYPVAAIEEFERKFLKKEKSNG
ncbi:hypothetical protein [Sneathiella sp.]|uniref:hypothetical protein n=1 Tax=Sneathiella sp. TaxID=1964365 RepID=UPI002FE34167